MTSNDSIRVRAARSGDEAIISHHRAGMFRDIGSLSPEAYDAMHAESIAWLERTILSGEYLGWLAHPANEPDRIVAGVGVLLRNAPPTVTREGGVRAGRQALVINVYTEPEWRQRGLARVLMQHAIEHCRQSSVMSIVLHAAPAGRHLYETLGFVPTNEMRLT